jgi:hypothetical protein
MKKMMFVLASSMLQKWLVSSVSPQPHAAVQGKINKDYILSTARSYANVLIVAYISSLFLVGGILLTIFATAQSFDLFGVFVPGAVFFSGLGIALVSLLSMAASIAAVRKKTVDFDQLYIFQQVPVPNERPANEFDIGRFIEPFLAGFKAARPVKNVRSAPPAYESPRPAHADPVAAGSYPGPGADLRAV